jgi:hypothetical protein
MGESKINRKIIGLTLSLLFLIINIPTTEAIDQNLAVTYQNCYIKSSGTILNRLALGLFKIGNKALIVYINVGYNVDAVTTIYDEENGNVLWHVEGQHYFYLFFFRGNYSYTESPEGTRYLSLDGPILVARI